MMNLSAHIASIIVVLSSLIFVRGGTLTFSCTGASQAFTAPDDSVYMTVKVCGAAGYGAATSSTNQNGRGYCVSDTLPLSPGRTYYIMVGCVGSLNSGGFNGGGDGVGSGGGGGGASDIRTDLSTLSSRLVVGAGGGGAGYYSLSKYYGGAGGCVNGSSGLGPISSGVAGFGTQKAGGAGGYFSNIYPSGGSGSLGDGGSAATYTDGGGGGGGYYGGGGGSFGSGGGGSSYGTSSKTCSSNTAQAGYVTITYYVRFTVEFPYAGGAIWFSNPGDVDTVQIQAWGAQGQNTSMGEGGSGGYVNATLIDYYYSTFSVNVGGSNGYPNGGSRSNPSSCNGGEAAAGGGYTVIKGLYGIYWYTLVIAGGGGGAGYDPACVSNYACVNASIDGGKGGSSLAGSGSQSPARVGSYGGVGGSSTSYGAGGYYNASYLYASSGSSSGGGNAAFDTCGGGGGGGSASGGGGSFTGGGGGTSTTYSPVVASSKTLGSSRAGDGLVVLTFTSAKYSPSEPDSDDDSVNVGGIVGFVLGSLFGVGCLFFCVYYACRQCYRTYCKGEVTAVVVNRPDSTGSRYLQLPTTTVARPVSPMRPRDEIVESSSPSTPRPRQVMYIVTPSVTTSTTPAVTSKPTPAPAPAPVRPVSVGPIVKPVTSTATTPARTSTTTTTTPAKPATTTSTPTTTSAKTTMTTTTTTPAKPTTVATSAKSSPSTTNNTNTQLALSAPTARLGSGVVSTTSSSNSVTKIEAAFVVMGVFLRSMMGSNDRCSVASFSDSYTIRANMDSEEVAIRALASCLGSVGGGTLLYDAIVVGVLQFISTANGSRPWIMVILTDGEDSGSGSTMESAIELLQAFNKPNNNFVFVVGLGRSLDDRSLKSMCSRSGSLYFRAQDLPVMQAVFAAIALKVVGQQEVTLAHVEREGVEAVFARVRERRAIVQMSMDMLILLDVSGSMNDPA